MVKGICKENLDKKICDCEDCSNESTYREFIQENEYFFGLEPQKLDMFTDEELIQYLDWIDDLWNK